MAIDLYINKMTPGSRAVIILINHLNLSGQFNFIEVDIRPDGTRSEELLKVNSRHTVPTLVEDNGAFVLAESRVILQYVVNRFAAGNSLYPSEAKPRALVDRVLFGDVSLFYPTVQAVYKAKFVEKTGPSEELLNELKRKLQGLDKLLSSQNQQFVGGSSVTIADISLATNIAVLKHLYSDYVSENLSAWYDRVQAAVPELKKSHDKLKEAMAAFK